MKLKIEHSKQELLIENFDFSVPQNNLPQPPKIKIESSHGDFGFAYDNV